MGTPPPSVVKRPQIVLPMPDVALPGHGVSWYAEVDTRLPAAVKAISIAVLIEVIFAPSMRVNVRRWVWASTTAMLLIKSQYVRLEYGGMVGRVTYIGTPNSTACCSAACRATRAPLCVRVGSEAVAAAVGDMLRCIYVEETTSEE
jgi:hypothetical protein